jgi:hypothetical protein
MEVKIELPPGAAVDDHHPLVVSVLEKVLERRAHRLDRKRVHSFPDEWNADLLDPQLDQTRSVLFQQQSL